MDLLTRFIKPISNFLTGTKIFVLKLHAISRSYRVTNKSFAGLIRLCWIINENDYEHCTTLYMLDTSTYVLVWWLVDVLFLALDSAPLCSTCEQSYDIKPVCVSLWFQTDCKSRISRYGMEEWFNFAWFPVEKENSRLLEICCWRGRIKLNFKERGLLLAIRLGVKKDSLSKKRVLLMSINPYYLGWIFCLI